MIEKLENKNIIEDTSVVSLDEVASAIVKFLPEKSENKYLEDSKLFVLRYFFLLRQLQDSLNSLDPLIKYVFNTLKTHNGCCDYKQVSILLVSLSTKYYVKNDLDIMNYLDIKFNNSLFNKVLYYLFNRSNHVRIYSLES